MVKTDRRSGRALRSRTFPSGRVVTKPASATGSDTTGSDPTSQTTLLAFGTVHARWSLHTWGSRSTHDAQQIYKTQMRDARSVLLVVLLLAPAAPTVGQPQPGQTISVKVVLVPDGDTFEAHRQAGQAFTVRLFGVDAPELNEPYGRKAQAAARHHIGGKTVRLQVADTGRYGQTIGRVVAQGGSLAKMLLRRGLARHDDQRAPDAAELARLERQARRAGRGLWSEVD